MNTKEILKNIIQIPLEKMTKTANRFVICFFLMFLLLKIQSQNQTIFLASPLSMEMNKSQVMQTLKDAKNNMKHKVFGEVNSSLAIVAYYKAGIDSGAVFFLDDKISSIHVYFSDSCVYNYTKLYLFENYKIKIRRSGSRYFFDNDYKFYIRQDVSTLRPAYSLRIFSKKYRISR